MRRVLSAISILCLGTYTLNSPGLSPALQTDEWGSRFPEGFDFGIDPSKGKSTRTVADNEFCECQNVVLILTARGTIYFIGWDGKQLRDPITSSEAWVQEQSFTGDDEVSALVNGNVFFKESGSAFYHSVNMQDVLDSGTFTSAQTKIVVSRENKMEDLNCLTLTSANISEPWMELFTEANGPNPSLPYNLLGIFTSVYKMDAYDRLNNKLKWSVVLTTRDAKILRSEGMPKEVKLSSDYEIHSDVKGNFWAKPVSRNIDKTLDLGTRSLDSVPISVYLVEQKGVIEQLVVRYHVPKLLDRTFTAYVVDVQNQWVALPADFLIDDGEIRTNEKNHYLEQGSISEFNNLNNDQEPPSPSPKISDRDKVVIKVGGKTSGPKHYEQAFTWRNWKEPACVWFWRRGLELTTWLALFVFMLDKQVLMAEGKRMSISRFFIDLVCRCIGVRRFQNKEVSSETSVFKVITNSSKSRYDSDFIQISEIGRGAFGKVYKCQHKLDQMNYAVKKVRLYGLQLDKITKEFRLLGKVNHPNIVRYHNAWFEELKLSDDELSSSTGEQEFTEVNSSLEQNRSTRSRERSLTFRELTPEDDPTVSSLSFSLTFSREGINSQAVSCGDNGKGFSDDYAPQTSNNATFSSKDSKTTVDEDRGSAWGKSSDSQPLSSKNRTNLYADHFLWADDPATTRSTTGSIPNSLGRHLKVRKNLFIQMEFCEQNLQEYMDASTKSGLWSTHKLILKQLVLGLDHMHSQHNIFHRDIKPKNILLNLSPFQVKLGDFGLATQTRSCDDLSEPNAILSVGVGTSFWVSPEQRNGGAYGPKSDIFSLGLVIFEVLFCKFWRTKAERSFCFRELKSSFSIPKIDSTDQSVIRLTLEMIKKMIRQNPDERPSAGDVLHRIENK